MNPQVNNKWKKLDREVSRFYYDLNCMYLKHIYGNKGKGTSNAAK